MSDTSTLKNLAVSETGFLFDPRSGATFTLNPTGLVVLRMLREGETLDAIIVALKDQFDSTGEELKDDVRDFVQSLKGQALLPNDFALT